MPIDKNSFIPAPVQIQAQLQGIIRSQQLPEGDPAPDEKELSRIFGVSRAAAHRALELLSASGFIHRLKRSGTFVSRPRIEIDLAACTGFTAQMTALGAATASRVFLAEKRRADNNVAMRLGIFRGTPVFFLRRLRVVDAVPLAVEESFLELARFDGIASIDFSANSLYAILRERFGVAPTRAESRVEAGLAGRAEARMLSVPPRVSLLRIERTVWGSDGRPVEVARTVYRGDRFRFLLHSA